MASRQIKILKFLAVKNWFSIDYCSNLERFHFFSFNIIRDIGHFVKLFTLFTWYGPETKIASQFDVGTQVESNRSRKLKINGHIDIRTRLTRYFVAISLK